MTEGTLMWCASTKSKLTVSQYSNIHVWIRASKTRPPYCEVCYTRDSARYEWANISGEYKKSLDDWKNLCVSCHLKIDRQYKCRNGHSRTPDNTAYRKNGWRGCKICIKNTARKVYIGRKARGLYAR